MGNFIGIDAICGNDIICRNDAVCENVRNDNYNKIKIEIDRILNDKYNDKITDITYLKKEIKFIEDNLKLQIDNLDNRLKPNGLGQQLNLNATEVNALCFLFLLI